MSLEIIKVINKETPEEEFVRLKATVDVNLENYAVIDNTYASNGGVSNIHRHFFRFPNKLDYVRLYTGVGKPKAIKHKEGYSSHYFYGGSKECIWNERTAMLLNL